MSRVLLVFISTFIFSVGVLGQNRSDNSFDTLLSAINGIYQHPLDAGYKPVKMANEPFWGSHFITFSRREQIEIKIILDTSLLDYPSIQAGRWLAQIASNDPDAVISRVPLEAASIVEKYQADWGGMYYFKPKFSSSFYRECKLLALYKEGKGMVFIFFLFNDFADQLQWRESIFQFLPHP